MSFLTNTQNVNSVKSTDVSGDATTRGFPDDLKSNLIFKGVVSTMKKDFHFPTKEEFQERLKQLRVPTPSSSSSSPPRRRTRSATAVAPVPAPVPLQANYARLKMLRDPNSVKQLPSHLFMFLGGDSPDEDIFFYKDAITQFLELKPTPRGIFAHTGAGKTRFVVEVLCHVFGFYFAYPDENLTKPGSKDIVEVVTACEKMLPFELDHKRRRKFAEMYIWLALISRIWIFFKVLAAHSEMTPKQWLMMQMFPLHFFNGTDVFHLGTQRLLSLFSTAHEANQGPLYYEDVYNCVSLLLDKFPVKPKPLIIFDEAQCFTEFCVGEFTSTQQDGGGRMTTPGYGGSFSGRFIGSSGGEDADADDSSMKSSSGPERSLISPIMTAALKHAKSCSPVLCGTDLIREEILISYASGGEDAMDEEEKPYGFPALLTEKDVAKVLISFLAADKSTQVQNTSEQNAVDHYATIDAEALLQSRSSLIQSTVFTVSGLVHKETKSASMVPGVSNELGNAIALASHVLKGRPHFTVFFLQDLYLKRNPDGEVPVSTETVSDFIQSQITTNTTKPPHSCVKPNYVRGIVNRNMGSLLSAACRIGQELECQFDLSRFALLDQEVRASPDSWYHWVESGIGCLDYEGSNSALLTEPLMRLALEQYFEDSDFQNKRIYLSGSASGRGFLFEGTIAMIFRRSEYFNGEQTLAELLKEKLPKLSQEWRSILKSKITCIKTLRDASSRAIENRHEFFTWIRDWSEIIKGNGPCEKIASVAFPDNLAGPDAFFFMWCEDLEKFVLFMVQVKLRDKVDMNAALATVDPALLYANKRDSSKPSSFYDEKTFDELKDLLSCIPIIRVLACYPQDGKAAVREVRRTYRVLNHTQAEQGSQSHSTGSEATSTKSTRGKDTSKKYTRDLLMVWDKSILESMLTKETIEMLEKVKRREDRTA